MAKILVIDDENAIGALMSRVIEQMGHSATYADTLKSGMQAVNEDNQKISSMLCIGVKSMPNPPT